MAEWSKATDCKSVEVFLRRFESCLSHLFVVDFREEKGKEAFVGVGRPTERCSFFFFFGREVKLYHMLVREVGELLRSIDSPSISNPNENRSESLPGSRSFLVLAYVVVGLPTRTRPPECPLGSGRSQADTYDR